MERYTKEEKKHCNEIIEFIRHSLKEEKFKIKEEFFVDGYLIDGDHYIWHVLLEDCPEWRFGVWIDIDDDNYVVSIFAQPINYIDKFKPSASNVLKEWTVYDVKELDNWDKKQALAVFKYVKEQPYLAWYRNMHYVDYNLEYVSPQQAKADYEECEKLRLLEEKIYKKLDEAEVKWMKNKAESLGLKYKITTDRDCSPRHEMVIEDPNMSEKGFYTWLEDDEWEEFKKIAKDFEKKYPRMFLPSTFNPYALFVKELKK